MKLEEIYCPRCEGMHPPGQHGKISRNEPPKQHVPSGAKTGGTRSAASVAANPGDANQDRQSHSRDIETAAATIIGLGLAIWGLNHRARQKNRDAVARWRKRKSNDAVDARSVPQSPQQEAE